MKEKGSLIVFVGPSGCGKGTVLSKYFKAAPNTFLSVSATTRKPRPGEQDGVNYYFKTEDEFKKLIETDGLLEWACYCGNYYGTPKKEVLEKLESGINVILEIEAQGAASVKEKLNDAVLVFVLPPSMEELRKRLEGRQTETAEIIEKRLAAAVCEIEFAKQCDYIIINDIADKAAENLDAIVKAAGHRKSAMLCEIDNILNNK